MHLGSDVRSAFRTLRRDPGLSAIAIATLALGIGANTAIFSVFDGILLRPLGYGDESRLVAIHEVVPMFSRIAPRLPVNAMHFEDWRRNVHAFGQIALISGITLNLTAAGEPERVAAARVSPSLFPMLHASAELGRTFLDEEDQPGRDDVVVLSHAFWQRRFASDPNILSRKIQLDGRPYRVIGVLSPAFHFPKLSQLFAMNVAEEAPELWKPFALRPQERDPLGDFNFVCIARLRPGVSLSQALGELNAAQARLASQAPAKIEFQAALVPLHDQITSRSRNGLQLVLAAVGLVLLIGCVNIANLLLARTASRRRELAIRSALGAGQGRLVRQLLAESLLLGGIGGSLGVLFAYGALRAILAHAPANLPRLDEVHVNLPVLFFATAISLVAGLACGWLPALRFARIDPQEALQSGARGSTEGRGAAKLRSLLVSLEVGLSMLCLIAGGLLLRSYAKLLSTDKGFVVQRIVTVDLNLPRARYAELLQQTRFSESLLDSVRKLPGVMSLGVSNMLPLTAEGNNNLLMLEGAQVPLMERPVADIRDVNPEFFRTMGIPLLKGRIFEDTDRNRQLALVSALTAQKLWPGQDPLGKRFKIGDPSEPYLEVAGVVGDVRGAALDKPPFLTIYRPYWEGGEMRRAVTLAVRTTGDPLSVTGAIRGAIHRIDPELPVPQFQTMEQILDDSVAQQRFQMSLILLFAAAALLLASLGIYGVVSYSVTLRTNEMGIRMALGAQGADVLRMVLRQSMAPVAFGLAGGFVVWLAAGRLLASLLYGVTPLDLLTIGIAMSTLAAVAALASFIPARRAVRVDPSTALRYE
ncbi:MAG TPA: ABC transporter permease [Bryobacteraceae bacterium]|nr:ABC transporter permease [Bryobacteraceae bacterium]